MAQAARGYSDPAGYLDPAGKRIDNLDLYHQTPYHRVLAAFFNGLQGDLYYPPYADSFLSTRLDPAYLELMVANYPDKQEYLSLLKKLCGNDLSLHSGSGEFLGKNGDDDSLPAQELPYSLAKPTGFSSFSLFYRKPELENAGSPELVLPDYCPPDLRIGHLRTGKDGRESLLLMSASHWGIHHDYDSLNIYYWKQGHEILSDLGYLWDHPLKPQTKRTFAHNTVVINQKNQLDRKRGGEVLLFETSDHVKVMEMSSSAYEEATVYKRTSAIIDHGNGRNYVVDFFRVEGGDIQDYVFHGVDKICEVKGRRLRQINDIELYDLQNIRTASGKRKWKVFWKSEDDFNCVAWSPGQADETVFVADGWGQRDWKNSDIGATIPYIVRRCIGSGMKTFISVFEGYKGDNPFVQDVKLTDPAGTIVVKTESGEDYIMSADKSGTLNLGKGRNSKKIEGHFAAGSLKDNNVLWSYRV